MLQQQCSLLYISPNIVRPAQTKDGRDNQNCNQDQRSKNTSLLSIKEYVFSTPSIRQHDKTKKHNNTLLKWGQNEANLLKKSMANTMCLDFDTQF